MALLHKICDQLLSKHHHIVRLYFKGHPALTQLPINEQLAPLVLECVLLFQKAVCNFLYLRFPKPRKLIKLGVDDHLDDLILVQLVDVLKSVLGLLRIF